VLFYRVLHHVSLCCALYISVAKQTIMPAAMVAGDYVVFYAHHCAQKPSPNALPLRGIR
jgi:hypothetical protein